MLDFSKVYVLGSKYPKANKANLKISETKICDYIALL